MNKRRRRQHLRLWLDALKKNKIKVTRAAQPGQRRNGVKNKAKKRKMRELKPATESNRAVGAPPPPPAEEAHIDQEKQFMMKLKQDQERALEAIAEQMVIEEEEATMEKIQSCN